MFHVHPTEFYRLFKLLHYDDPSISWHDMLIDRELILDYRMPAKAVSDIRFVTSKLVDTTRTHGVVHTVSEHFGKHKLTIKGVPLTVWRVIG